jgi:hypothetical protein
MSCRFLRQVLVVWSVIALPCIVYTAVGHVRITQ